MPIRDASIQDAEAIRDLVLSLSHLYLANQHSSLPEWFVNTLRLDVIRVSLTDHDQLNLLYETDGEVVGYAAIKNNIHISQLFVATTHQRQGIARQLWQQVMQRCKAQVYTVRSSLYAVPVYQRFGFKMSEAVAEKDGIFYQPMEYVV